MQSRANIYFFVAWGMNLIVKPKVYDGSSFSCDTFIFYDTYLYTANKNVMNIIKQ